MIKAWINAKFDDLKAIVHNIKKTHVGHISLIFSPILQDETQ